ncbi:MAG: MATE family efflux transporter [Clostridia bacterium]|nr:MATE family efflux transporter [Clostridia bacterium]
MVLGKYFGNKAFYKRVLAVSIPIMVQNSITQFVNLLDNVMVGSLGTEQMSGVSIVNQFIFIFNLLIFGAVSAAGIFTAQFHGRGDVDGVRYTFRLKFLINITVSVLAVVLFIVAGDVMINSFLHDGRAEGNLELTHAFGKEYLTIMLFGMIPYAITQVYASTMKETGETFFPMIASVVAVATNFVLNCILIFGLLGCPALGVKGAAIATVISRFAEFFILVIRGHSGRARSTKYPFLIGAYRSLYVPYELVKKITVKGLPLMMNEVLWACAMTLRNQCYSTRGLDAVAALNISTTVLNLFNVVYMSLSNCIAIMVGNQLGAGELEEAKDTDRKLIVFSVLTSAAIGLIIILASPLVPLMYNTTESVRSLASYMITVAAAIVPFCAYAHASYFTMRSGGKIFLTIVFDSIYMWAVVVPVSCICAYLTPMNIWILFLVAQSMEILKALLGWLLIRRGTWARKLV